MAVAKRRKHKQIVLKRHHSKAYRKRQLASLALTTLLLASLVLQAGIMIGRTQPGATPARTDVNASRLSSIRSSYGYAFDVDANAFDLSATRLGENGVAQTATQEQLRGLQPLTSTFIKPRPGSVQRLQAATQFSVQVDPNAEAYSRAKQNPGNAGLSAAQVAAQLFPVTSSSELDVSVLSSQAETLNSTPMQKTVYQYTPKFNGAPSYAIVWTGVSQGRAYAVKLQGLVGASTIPAAYEEIFASLTLDGDQNVQGVSTGIKRLMGESPDEELAPVEDRYLSDAYSPAVVKIYSATCGTLMFYGQALGGANCFGSTGSGFFMTENGYIATNGHVVTYTAQDALVDALLADPAIFATFLVQVVGMTPDQASRVLADPSLLASIIIKIYDIPSEDLSFAQQETATMVSTGIDAPSLNGMLDRKDLTEFKRETRSVKQARIIATDYTAKDVYTAIVDPEAGFSASDVAIIKIRTQNAPTIALGTNVRQNEKIIVAGFPGDADNMLTDNSEISISVTNGTISSIRKAAGGKGNLYQSDVDASPGNSGGPAINEGGEVIGLLTYRFDAGGQGNAAKSYIRDIDDVRRLASKNNITIDNSSTTQAAWQRGLASYGTNRYSKAVKDFEIVTKDFPSHRLVSSYVSSSQQAITDGKDVKDFPLTILLIGIAGMIVAVGVVGFVIIRHHARHKIYQAYQPAMPGGAPGPQGYPVPHPAVQPPPPPPQYPHPPQYPQ